MASAVDFFFTSQYYSDKHKNNLDLAHVLFLR